MEEYIGFNSVSDSARKCDRENRVSECLLVVSDHTKLTISTEIKGHFMKSKVVVWHSLSS